MTIIMMSEGRVLQSAPSRQSWERDLHMLEAGHYCVITQRTCHANSKESLVLYKSDIIAGET